MSLGRLGCLALWLQGIGVSWYASCTLSKIMVSVPKSVDDFLYALEMIGSPIPTVPFLHSATSRPRTEHAPFHAHGNLSDGALSLMGKRPWAPHPDLGPLDPLYTHTAGYGVYLRLEMKRFYLGVLRLVLAPKESPLQVITDTAWCLLYADQVVFVSWFFIFFIWFFFFSIVDWHTMLNSFQVYNSDSTSLCILLYSPIAFFF